MTRLLTELLAAGLVEKLEGDDGRFEKIERAANAVAGELRANPKLLIPAILAGLDPDVPPPDPAIQQAQRALVAEWKSMSSVHTSTPVAMLRAILLDGCEQAAEGKNASILWLTAADTLPMMRLGREEPAVRHFLQDLANKAEESALVVPKLPGAKKVTIPEISSTPAPPESPTWRADRDSLRIRISAASGPQYRGKNLPNKPNPHWPHADGNWSAEFADRFSELLAEQLDSVAIELAKAEAASRARLDKAHAALKEGVTTVVAHQQQWVQGALRTSEARETVERTRLDALWWSEALYSPLLRRSYRDLPPEVAVVLMATDLLAGVSLPTPASVAYLLAETVGKLPGAAFERRIPLGSILGSLREHHGLLPDDWRRARRIPAPEGRLSLRDLVVMAAGDQEWTPTVTLHRARLDATTELSLPALARVFFRQEQAVQLAAGGSP